LMRRCPAYLRITKRADVAALAEGLADELCADKEVFQNPENILIR